MLEEISNKQEWEKLTDGLAHARFTQSWAWGEYSEVIGEKVYRFAGEKGFAQVIERRLPMGFKLWYVPSGPAGFSENELGELARKADEAGAILLRFEPDAAPKIGKLATSVSPEVTRVSNLTLTEDQLLSAMHQKTRYNLRLAEKKGVKIIESKDPEVWLKLMNETTTRDGFRAHPNSHYRKMIELGVVKLVVAEFEVQPLAALLATFYGDTVTYLHGASSNTHRELMAPYLLHWELMREAKRQGFAYYDWWGVNPSDESHRAFKASWAGISRFKAGFGGEEVRLPGTYEIVTKPFWAFLYALRRRLLRTG